MDLVDAAWMVVNHWIKNDYGNDKAAAAEELGDLDKCVLRVIDCIDANELLDDWTDIHTLASNVELAGY